MIFNTITFAALFATAVSGLTITPTGDANTLAKAILGSSPGIKLVSASYAGSPDSSGTYTDGPQGIRNAAVLTSGDALDTIIAPGDADISKSKGTAGSPLCSSLAGGATSYDAAVLTMNVELLSGFTGFFTEFIFASEEYPEWVGSQFNDVMGIYVDGKQIAFDSQNAPITINGPFFMSDKVLVPPASGSNFDGSTPILKSGHVAPIGAHKIEIAICDIADRLRDSSVFVTLGACTGECKEGTTVSPCAGKGGDSDGDGICDDVDNCPNHPNPDQNPAACGVHGTGIKGTGTGGYPIITSPPKYHNNTAIGTATITPPCVTLTSMVTKTITTCTQKTICHPTVTVEPVTYTSTISLTVTTPCSTYTVSKCPGGPGSPCYTYTNTVTLAPVTTYSHPAVVTNTYKCPGGPHCPATLSTSIAAVPSVPAVTYKCPGGPYCPASITSTYTYTCPGGPYCPVVTYPAGCPGGAHCPPMVTAPVPAATTTPVYGCPGGPGCPPIYGSGNKTTPTVPQYTGAAGRVGTGAAGVVGAVGAFAVLLL